LGKRLGYLASLTYSRKYSFYENGEVGRYRLSGNFDQADALTNDFLLKDTQGNDEVLWGELITTSYTLDSDNELGFNFIHTQSGESTARYLTGKFYDGNLPEDAIYETRVLKYIERTLNSVQLKGEHHFANIKGINLIWSGNYSANYQDEPDLRFFSDHYTVAGVDTFYTIRPSLYTVPQRYFRNLKEDSYNFDIKMSVPFKQWSGLISKFDFGGYYSGKNRTFRERIFELHIFRMQIQV
jgi:hypothetical protein